jgi:serine/threonine protein kinase
VVCLSFRDESSMAKSTPIQIGDTICDKYRVERVLGEGGVGVVLLGRHLELDQLVALKVLLAADDEEHVKRFIREARASVRMKGEHVVRVMDVGRLASGTPFMVMEYLEGEDLGEVVGRGALGVADAADFLLQACEGIAEAHALGIIHRDLKPQNLFLTRRTHKRPMVKVLDFGIAKSFSPLGDEKALTATQAVIGSPRYMSPEQMRASRDVDVRTDVWSLGVCLYEFLAGTAPFDGYTLADLCARVLTQEPTPIRELRADVPEALSQVIAGCLRKDPRERISDVAELAAGVEPFAPYSAKGSAERILTILQTPISVRMSDDEREPAPAPAPPPAATGVSPIEAPDHLGVRTAATFESLHEAPASRPRWARGKWVAVGGVGALGLVALTLSLTGGREPTRAGASVDVAAAHGAELPPSNHAEEPSTMPAMAVSASAPSPPIADPSKTRSATTPPDAGARPKSAPRNPATVRPTPPLPVPASSAGSSSPSSIF